MEWINTKDELPEPETPVLVYFTTWRGKPINGGITLAEYQPNSGWWDLTSDGVGGWNEDEIEWWMPLPNPPK